MARFDFAPGVVGRIVGLMGNQPNHLGESLGLRARTCQVLVGFLLWFGGSPTLFSAAGQPPSAIEELQKIQAELRQSRSRTGRGERA